MRRSEPTNETYLAAELATARAGTRHGVRVSSYACAMAAHDVCSWGRAYFRLSERLCGGEEEWGRYPEAGKRIERAEKRRERIRAKIVDRLAPFGVNVDSDGGGLGLVAHVKMPRLHDVARTALR